MITQGSSNSFPALLMAVVVQHQRCHPALGISLNRKPRKAVSVRIEKNRSGLRRQLGNFSIVILLVEQLALAKERHNNQPALIHIFAREAVKLGRRELQGWWVQRNGNALREGWRFLRLAPMQQQPAGQIG